MNPRKYSGREVITKTTTTKNERKQETIRKKTTDEKDHARHTLNTARLKKNRPIEPG